MLNSYISNPICFPLILPALKVFHLYLHSLYVYVENALDGMSSSSWLATILSAGMQIRLSLCDVAIHIFCPSHMDLNAVERWIPNI